MAAARDAVGPGGIGVGVVPSAPAISYEAGLSLCAGEIGRDG